MWKLVEQSGKPVPLETLENKVLAVDISIWLHQVIKGFQDSKGSSLPNAHILGLFHRLCKLMYYRIRPVFVFDGGVPALKRQTIAKRNQSKSKYHNEADRLQQLLLETLAKEKVVQQALGSATSLLVSPSKKPGNNSKTADEPDEIFKLPPLKEDSPFKNADSSQTDLDDSTSSWDEKTSKSYYHLNLNAIDVTSVHFKNLPADVRHDILNDIKETRKQNSWGRLHELPVESNDFSSFQMKRLLKRRAVQVELEEAEKEMGGKCLSLAELEALLSEEGVDTSSSQAAQKIASDENTRFLLVRDVQKAIEKAKIKEEQEKNAPKPPKLAKSASMKTETIDVLDDKEMDEELQLAIKMSLMQDEDPNVKINLEQDEVQMSKQQKQALGNSAMTLARGFMLEYGGMSNDDVRELLHQTQDVDPGEIEQSFTQMFAHNSVSVLKGTDDPEDKQETQEVVVSSDTDTDSDFIDVPEDDLDDMTPGVLLPLNPSNHLKPLYSTVVDFRLEDLAMNKDGKKVLEVVIDESKIGKKDEEDIFADVFEKSDDRASKLESLKVAQADTENPTEQVEKPSCGVSVSKVSEPLVAPKITGIKVKKVDDINARLQEELQKLKTAPAISLDDILLDLPQEDNDLVQVIETVQNHTESNKPENVRNIVKQELEKLKSQTPVIDLDEIKLDEALVEAIPDKLEVKLTKTSSDAEDSDATVGYSPMKELQKVLKDSELSRPDNLQQINEHEPEQTINTAQPVYTTPKKGTLEHLVKSRTPGSDSKKSEPEEDIPNVPKPFFVNKTPTSSSKKNKPTESESTPSKPAKVSKELFPEPEPIPSTSKGPQPTAENMITDMADNLKENKTPLELKRMALNLAQTERELEKEKNRQSRLGTSITEQMQEDCMQLLRLFGIPYIVAPMEAEAQCAFLNQIQITDGTITDDSDIWLFGGQTVYKNFFNQQKLVLEFTADSIERLFQMDRKKLIQLALLVGSDYTTGISGIGAVTAMEILASFPATPEKDGETSEMMSLLSGLRKFRDWWNHGRNNSVGTRITLKSKLKNIEFTDGFPSSGVVEAYLFPTVDSNKEPFSWGYPDVESLRDFTKQKFGWPQAKFNDIIMPVVKRLDERKSQASIKNYFKVQSAVANNQLKVSKRVQTAVDAMAGKITEEPSKSPKKKVARKRKPKAGEANPDGTQATSSEVICLSENSDDDFTEPKKTRGRKTAATTATKSKPKSTRKAATKANTSEIDKPSTSLVNIGSIISKINDQSAEKLGDEAAIIDRKRAAKNKIPDFNPAIPQRLKDEEEMVNRKQRAIELFKKSQTESKVKKSRK